MITQDQIDEWNKSEEYYNGVDPETRDYMTVSEMVQEFHQTAGQNTGERDVVSQVNMVKEEWAEFTEAWDLTTDDTHKLKEMSDLIYVLYGLARAKGWDLETAVRRVHENNMGRMYQEDGTIKRREDGKILKNKDYPKVDLNDLVGSKGENT